MPEPLHAQSHDPAGDDPLLGRLLDGRFRILKLLGRGGTSSVYLARDENLDRQVAVKLLDLSAADAQTFLERFRREAMAGSALEHPGIVRTLAVGQYEGRPYLVMEYLNGATLAALLANSRLEPTVMKTIFLQVMEALAHAHSRGIFHRDVKPSNIMVEQRGTSMHVRIVDFGIAKVSENTEQKLTQTGAIVGSAPYMSPEQCTGGHVDARSDIYSLGCVIYEALSGQAPFVSQGGFDTLYKHVHESAAPLRARNPAVSRELEAFVKKALEKEPARRYQSIDEMSEALRRIRTSPGGNRAFAGSRIWLAGGTAILATVVAAAFVTRQSRQQQTSSGPYSSLVPIRFAGVAAQADDLASDRVNKPAESIELCRRWLKARSNDPRVPEDDKARCRLRIAETMRKTGGSGQAVALLVEAAKAKIAPDLKMKILWVLSRVHQETASPQEAYRAAQEAYEIGLGLKQSPKQATRSDFVALAGDLCALAYLHGDYALAARAGADLIEVAKGYGQDRWRSVPLRSYALALDKLGRVDEAEQIFQLRINIAEGILKAEDRYAFLSGQWRDKASFYIDHGRFDKALECVKHADDAAAHLSGNAALYERLYNELHAGACYRAMGNLSKARTLIKDALGQSDRLTDGSEKTGARLEIMREYMLVFPDDETTAIQVLEKCLDSYLHEMVSTQEISTCCRLLSECYRRHNRRQEALDVLRKTVQAWRDHPREIEGLNGLVGAVDLELYPHLHHRIVSRLLTLERARNADSATIAHLRFLQAAACFKMGRIAEARTGSTEAIELAKKTPSATLISAVSLLAAAYDQEHNIKAALRVTQTYKSILPRQDSAEFAHFLMQERHILLENNKVDESIAAGRNALEIYSRLGSPGHQGEALYGLSDAYGRKDDYKAALACADRAVEFLEQAKNLKLCAKVCIHESELCRRSGNPAAARCALKRARKYAQQAQAPGLLKEIADRERTVD